MKTKPTTPATINEANRAYWERRNEKLGQMIQDWQPGSVAEAQALLLVEEDQARLSEAQRSRAQASRPKKKATIKSETVAAMKPWRADGSTLADFVDAAEAGSLDGFGIKRSEHHGIVRYVVEADAVADEKAVAHSTLEGWWKEASATK